MKQSAYDAKTLKDLSDLCYQALCADPVPGRVAVPFLHFLSAHPSNLTRYNALLEGKPPGTKKVRNLIGRLKLASISRFAKAHLWEGDPLPSGCDILFISHFLRPEQAATGEDIYFGSLPKDLAEAGVGSVVALIDHNDTPWHRLRGNWSSNGMPRVLLRRVIHDDRERFFRREMRRTDAALRSEAKTHADGGGKLFLEHAAADAGSAASLTALRIGHQVAKLVEQLKPKLIVTTFEGHGWERLAFRSARNVDPEICCAGYHHAVLFPMQHALTRRLGHGFDPDVILTAGTVTRDYFSSQPALADVPIAVLGSSRGTENSESVKIPKQGDRCLVLPEGIASESLLLSKLAVALAKLQPQQLFTIRLHPLLSPKQLIAHDVSLKILPDNVKWSTGSLESDLEDNRWVIYRGSSAVFAAIGAGLKPIYFCQESRELSIDPLRSMVNWRDSCSTPKTIIECMRNDLNISNEDRIEEWKIAREFCRRYFIKFQEQNIENIINGNLPNLEK